MRTRTLILAILLAFATATTALAQHADVVPYAASGKLLTGSHNDATLEDNLESRVFGYDVFISFALGGPPRGTQSYASDLARRLRERDFTVFFSEDEASPGAELDAVPRGDALQTLQHGLRSRADMEIDVVEQRLRRKLAPHTRAAAQGIERGGESHPFANARVHQPPHADPVDREE